MTHLSKEEIIDKVVNAHLLRFCIQEYEIKYGKLPQLEKPIRDVYMNWDKIESGCYIAAFENLDKKLPNA